MLHTSQGKPLMPMEECILDKTLLILGAGPDQIPGILKAKEMGIYTIGLDGNSQAPGRIYCDEFYEVSIKHIEQIEDFIGNKLTKKVDGVIAFGIDIASVVSRVANVLNINYTIPLKSAELSEDKFHSKEFMKRNNIQIPQYKLVNDVKDIKKFISLHGLPVVLKPIDNSASRGISYIEEIDNLEYFFNYALTFSKQKRVIVEQYLSGHQISTESFIIDGEVYNIGFADRNYTNMNKFFPNIIENGGDLPSIFMHEKHKKELEQYFKLIVQELHIENGIIKGDVVIHENQVYIIEFALRLSGGNFSTIEIPKNTGIDFLKIAIKLHLNMQIFSNELKQRENNCISLRYKFIEDENFNTSIKEISIPLTDENIIDYKVYAKIGDNIEIKKTTNHLDRFAYVIAKGKSRDEAIMSAELFLNNIKVR